MYLNVWLPYNPVMVIALGLIALFATWKIVIAVIKSIPFV